LADLLRIVRTTTFKLTVLYAAVFALSITIVAGFLYWSTIGALQNQTDATIEAEVTGLAEQYRADGLRRLVGVIRDRIAADPDSRALYLFADRNYSPLAGNLAQWPELVSRDDGWYSFVHHSGEDQVTARARVFALSKGLVLLVGREITDLDRTAVLFRNALAWGGGLAIVLSLVGGAIMSGSVLRRIEQINATTRRIMSGDLSQRVASRGTADELDQLVDNLNAMLEEIERLMDGVRHVADNIAHDLRTPLTRLRNALEEAEHAADPDSARGHVEAALADADNLLRTFNALLRIARLESGSYETGHHRVALRTLVEDATELYQAVAEDKKVTLSASCCSEGEIEGDRDLLFQLLVNLIDNAVKYTPPGGVVEIRLDDVGENVNLTVCDTGPGVPESLRDRVLERFFRLDSSRRVAGNGLGLSLVQAIARHHDAVLELGENDPGLRVEVRFRPDASDSVP